jgi:O-antigen ligase
VHEKDRDNPNSAEATKRFSRVLDSWPPSIADGLVVSIAVSLPWSTSATAILIVLWFISLVPTLDAASLRREAMSPAGGLPALLWLLGAAGMLWAHTSWSERIADLSGFHKLLFVPVLLAQFRRSGRGHWVLLGLLGSSSALLLTSWILALLPGLTWRGKVVIGVPVKDYIFQSELFAICALGLVGQAALAWRTDLLLALGMVAAAALFLGNILYVETARTTLVVILALVCLLGVWKFGWKGGLGACMIGIALLAAAWTTSPHLRGRILGALHDVQAYEVENVTTPVGQRFAYWGKSLKFIATAPVLGHGTGSVLELFRRDATPQTNPKAITANPHNQVLVIALELGVIGVLLLLAMWASHLALFHEHVLFAWFGLVLVVQNIVSCLFNSHLFDFTQGWLYVFGVGVIGGTVLYDMDVGVKAGSWRLAPVPRGVPADEFGDHPPQLAS